MIRLGFSSKTLASLGALWLGVVGASALACSSSTPPSAPANRARARSQQPKRSAAGPPALRAARVASVATGTYGPYVATGAGRPLLLWAEASPGADRHFWSVALRPDLSAASAPRRIAEAPQELGLMALKPAGPLAAAGQASSGYIAVSASPRDEGFEVSALLLTEQGEARVSPVSLTRDSGDVLWVDAVATQRGTLALWASKRKGRATVLGSEIDLKGTRLTQPAELVRDAGAWQTAALPGRLAIAYVQTTAAQSDRGSVRVELLGTGARADRKSVLVNPEPTAQLDLDMIAVGGSFVLAWSDAREVDSRVYAAVLDGEGKLVRKPGPMVDALGEQALVQLVAPFPGSETGYVAWETLSMQHAPLRKLEVTTVDAQAKTGVARGQLSIDAPAGTLPELKAAAGGLAALTLAPACPVQQRCDDAERVPTFVQFDRDFGVAASEPLRLAALGGDRPALAWGLSCLDSGCFALSALTSSPAPIFAVELARKSAAFIPAGNKRTLQPPPRARALTTVAALDPVADISAAKIGSTTLAAWVSYFDPSLPWERLKKAAPDGRYEPLRARLEVRAFREDGSVLPTEVVSLRARSVGGVALAAGDPARKEALLAWSAEDNKQPQVFVTLLRDDGKRITQKMLTRRDGEVSDVAVAFAGDGFIVGWIDERDGDPEVYVTKVNRALQRVGTEQRLTQARGAATGLSLLTVGNEVLALWADARDAEQPGSADLHAARLRATDAAVLAPEQRIVETRAHSHSPALALRGSEPVVAWIEDALGQQRNGVLKVATLDAQGRATNTASVNVGAGSPLSVSLSCEGQGCYAALAVDRGGKAAISALPLFQTAKPRELTDIADAAAQAVPPALLGAQLFFADLGTGQQQGVVRRMLIDWK